MIESDVGEVFVLYLDPARRREGIGSLLLDAISEQQRAHGAHEQWVSVEPDNAKGLPFYLARGFRVRGDRPAWGTALEGRVSLRLMRRLDDWHPPTSARLGFQPDVILSGGLRGHLAPPAPLPLGSCVGCQMGGRARLSTNRAPDAGALARYGVAGAFSALVSCAASGVTVPPLLSRPKPPLVESTQRAQLTPPLPNRSSICVW